jgi:hypothetical protein
LLAFLREAHLVENEAPARVDRKVPEVEAAQELPADGLVELFVLSEVLACQLLVQALGFEQEAAQSDGVLCSLSLFRVRLIGERLVAVVFRCLVLFLDVA